MTGPRKPRIGLALGGGSARGWAHIGVIRALERAGVHADVVAGTSIGALVGAAYAAGELSRLERWALELRVTEVIGFMDLTLSGGAFKGDRLIEFFRRGVPDRPIETLPIAFGAVATSLNTGAEVWLRSGSLLDAIRASIALPGIFTPVMHDGEFLVDGGLVNPVPVSLAKAMGADFVIAVDLSSDIVGRRFRQASRPDVRFGNVATWIQNVRESVGLSVEAAEDAMTMPSLPDVLAACMDIVQVRIARSRMAGEPPELLVAPRLARLRLFDFHCASEAIEEGERAVERVGHVVTDLRPDSSERAPPIGRPRAPG
jgi:NTE family protein